MNLIQMINMKKYIRRPEVPVLYAELWDGKEETLNKIKDFLEENSSEESAIPKEFIIVNGELFIKENDYASIAKIGDYICIHQDSWVTVESVKYFEKNYEPSE